MNGPRKRIVGNTVICLIAGLSLVAGLGVTPAGASASKTGIVPVGAVPRDDRAGQEGTPGEHGMGALLPKDQVDAKAPARNALAALPASIDLSSYSVPVGDQGSIGSCVAWAIAYGMLGWYSRHDNRAGQPFAPMYMYSQIHYDNSPDGGGSFPVDALKLATNQGNDTKGHYTPTDILNFKSQPDASEMANAKNFKIAGWQTLFANATGQGGGTAGATVLRTALATGEPVAIGLRVRPGFENMADSPSTLDDDISGASTGRHEVLAVGYDQYGLWIQNSWGTSWGYNGYGRLSWRVVGHDVYDAHTISGFATGSTTDTTPPEVGTVARRFSVGNTITNTTVPVTFSWSATDASGIAAYAVQVKTDGGLYVQDTTVSATGKQVTYSLLAGHSYRLAVAAKDTAGNWSGYSESAIVTPSLKDDKTFSASSPWTRYSLAGTYGGTYTAASQAGAWWQMTATGSDIALIAPKFATAGRATLYCDGTSLGPIDGYNAATVTRQVLAWCHFATSGQHTMKIVLEGTSSRPWFGVDAFAVLS